MRDSLTDGPARLARRLLQLIRRRALEERMDEEMRHHLECEAADRIRRGMSEEEAWRTARRDFGGVERHKEDARDVRGVRALEDAMRDASYAGRVLRRNPAFSLAVILTFALGIGCTSSIFSVVYGILGRPLPYEDPAALFTLWERNDSRRGGPNVVSVRVFEAWRSRARSFTGVAALVPDPLTLDGAPSERLKGVQVSPGYFTMLGVRPRLGRDFEAADGVVGGAPVAILSNGLWRSRYGGDRAIIGRTISIDGRPVTVVGIMGPDFEPPQFGWITDQPLWLPFAATEENRRWGRVLHVVARLAPGVTTDAANNDLASLSTQLAAENAKNRGWSALMVPLAGQITGDVRTPLLVLFAAVTLLLAMSAVNVASLVTAFAAARRHELVVRRTMGATVARLVGQQLMQSALLGAVGTALGLILGYGATHAIVALLPPTIPRLNEVRVNGAVVLFSASIALVTTVAYGLAGAWRAIGGTAAPSLSEGASGARTTSRLSGAWIIGSEVAIGLVLTVLAALMVRSVANLRAVDLGFDAQNLVSGRVSLPSERYENDARRDAFFDALLARARATPGVTSASIVTSRPFACCAPSTAVRDPAKPGTMETAPITAVRYVDDSYFATMRIPVLAGTVFTPTESRPGEAGDEARAVVSRSLARTLWGDEPAVGKTIALALNGTITARVIGVVGDVHLVDARTPVRPTTYVSTRRYPESERDVVLRGTIGGAALLSALRTAVAAVDPSLPLYMTTTFEGSVSETLAQDRATSALLDGFAVLSLLLATIGVYGVLAGDVGRRKKELGIRRALGARAPGLTALVLGRALRPAVIGACIGLGLAMVLARFMRAMVFGVGTWDPVSFAGVTAVLLAVTVAATLVPALRAARVSPIEAIRGE